MRRVSGPRRAHRPRAPPSQGGLPQSYRMCLYSAGRRADFSEGTSWSCPLARPVPALPPGPLGFGVWDAWATLTQALVEGEPWRPLQEGGLRDETAPLPPNLDRPWHPLLRKAPTREEGKDWRVKKEPALPRRPPSDRPWASGPWYVGWWEGRVGVGALNLSTHYLLPPQLACKCGATLSRAQPLRQSPLLPGSPQHPQGRVHLGRWDLGAS